LSQALGRFRRIARVPPQAFWPPPAVESVMLRWDRDPSRALSLAQRQALSSVVHHCFHYRRKTMHSSLRTLIPAAVLSGLIAGGEWDLGARPEQLTPEEWIHLAAELPIPP